MNRSDLIRRMVLNAICDDYENVDQVILRDIAKNGARLGLAVERSDILAALAELIEDGLAKAYFLSSTEPAASPRFHDIANITPLLLGRGFNPHSEGVSDELVIFLTLNRSRTRGIATGGQ